MKIKKILWIVLGFTGLILGAIGEFLPILPSVPFLLLSAFCFSKSSEKLHAWFLSTKLHKNNLETFVEGEGMSKNTKIKIMITTTLLMAFGFFIMFNKNLYVPCAILGCIWLFHNIYFTYGVKTHKQAKKNSRND